MRSSVSIILQLDADIKDGRKQMEHTPKVKSLAKAIDVLECFLNHGAELGVSEISQALSIHKSTVHNILNTFMHKGYLTQDKKTGKYSLSVKLLQYSYIINNHIGLEKILTPFIKSIANQLNLMVYLGIPYHDEVLYIACAFPENYAGWRNIMGEHAPMYCTGIGKAMLANFPENVIDDYISRPLEKFTENTITNPDELRDHLLQINKRGWAVDNMEHEYGITCVGVPVFSHDRRVIAAVSASASSLLLRDDMLKSAAATIIDLLSPIQYKL
ncbi:MAG: IclR family transcriptional regulator [Crenarchaeota archaeon]|nr:IclR family transcriptional regulator [Thermoproteota archaeon]